MSKHSELDINISKIKSKRGALKRYSVLVNKCYNDAKGGTSFGIDMPTMLALWPDRHAEILAIKRIYPTLPD